MKRTIRFLALCLALTLCAGVFVPALADAEAPEVFEETPAESAAAEIPAEEEPAEEAPEAPEEAAEEVSPAAAEDVPGETAGPVTDGASEEITEEQPAEEDMTEEPILDGYGTIISSATDPAIEKMLALIDNQNFSGSGITAEKAKELTQHFLFTSNFAAIDGGAYSYPNSGGYTTSVNDGYYTRTITGSKGCMSYCRFVSMVFYSREGALKYSAQQSGTSLKTMLLTYAQAGDHIRMGSRHSVIYISGDSDGFYCLSYQGDSTRRIRLEYWSYGSFANYYSGSAIGIYDANTAVNSVSGEDEDDESAAGESTLSVTSVTAPSGTLPLGKSFSLSGVISSNYNITAVSAAITNSAGEKVLSYSVSPNAKSYNIRTGGLDNAMTFAKLAAGSYTYIVTATDESGKTLELISTQFVMGTESYTVTYDANGGSNAPASQTKAKGSSVTLSLQQPTRSGYNFAGWASSASASAAEYAAGGTYSQDANITLYAVWTAITEGICTVDGVTYCYDSNGSKVTGWVTLDDAVYYFDPSASGAMTTGWKSIGTASGGHPAGWYYFNDAGIMQTGWLKYGTAKYYLDDTTGCMLSSTHHTDTDGKIYYFNASGVPVTGWQWLAADGSYPAGWYYFDASGVTQTGWVYLGSVWYYLEPVTGIMHEGWLTYGNSVYYLKSGGAMATGWYWCPADSTHKAGWYYFSASGDRQTGTVKYGSTTYRLDDSTGRMLSDERYTASDGKTYYYDASGALGSGWYWLAADGSYPAGWYYFNTSGVMQTGWVYLGSVWYYLEPSTGVMHEGWLTYGNSVYYLKSGGAMAVGWYWCAADSTHEAGWYYFSGSGDRQTGWVKYGTAEYYLDDNGKMVTGQYTCRAGNGHAAGTYTFNGSGELTTK